MYPDSWKHTMNTFETFLPLDYIPQTQLRCGCSLNAEVILLSLPTALFEILGRLWLHQTSQAEWQLFSSKPTFLSTAVLALLSRNLHIFVLLVVWFVFYLEVCSHGPHRHNPDKKKRTKRTGKGQVLLKFICFCQWQWPVTSNSCVLRRWDKVQYTRNLFSVVPCHLRFSLGYWTSLGSI